MISEYESFDHSINYKKKVLELNRLKILRFEQENLRLESEILQLEKVRLRHAQAKASMADELDMLFWYNKDIA